jgi:predicted transcriptional regulator
VVAVRPTYRADDREAIGGLPVTEAQISAWAAEAERGYDVAALRKRGRGRPGRGAGPTQVVPLRLTQQEVALVDSLAEREGKTRSDVLRDALMAYAT